MKTALKIVLGVLIVLVVAAASVYAWASHRTNTLLSRTIQTHRIEFPIPPLLSDAEVQEIREERMAAGEPAPTDADLTAIARQRSVERGSHLVHARYACVECHGQDFGGGVMVDDPMLGTILGPNITAGQGGRTASYTPSDWDRAVRHGVKPDGTPSAMPADDFQRMSDQELADIVTYIRSRPTVDATIPRPTLGPLGKVLMAFGQMPLAADVIPDHERPHAAFPPPADVNVDFGRHLSGVCSGCHGADFTGGKIAGGDPSWPPAANLTPHPDGLAGWTYRSVRVAGPIGQPPRWDGSARADDHGAPLPAPDDRRRAPGPVDVPGVIASATVAQIDARAGGAGRRHFVCPPAST